MIVSDSHKFVFLHLPKCGGGSVTQALADVGRRELGPHTGLRFAVEHLGERWEQYFTFEFVRNPWSRLVSRYEYAKQYHGAMEPGGRHAGHVRFCEYVGYVLADNHRSQWKALSDPATHTKLAVDFVGKCERMQADFDVVCERVGLGRRVLEVHRTTEHGDYREYYDATLRAVVGATYERDIEEFDYAF